MIKSSEIDVIVQGFLDERYTQRVCKSIRTHLASSRIILSTWQECEEKADYLKKIGLVDEYVLSEDPKTRIQNYKDNSYINLNRQIVSTKAALPYTNRKYVLKTRSDIEILSDEFIRKYEKEDQAWCKRRDHRYVLFEHFLLVSSFYTRNVRIMPMAYHVSDWLTFGHKKDIEQLYSLELPEEEFYSWFKNHPKKTWLYRDYVCRYGAEQYFLIQMLQRDSAEAIKELRIPENYYDADKTVIEESEKVIAYNYVIDDYERGSFLFLKYNPNRYFDSLFCYGGKDLEIIRAYNSSGKIHKQSQKFFLAYWRYILKTVLLRMYTYLVLGGLSNVLKAVQVKKIIKKLLDR